MKYCYIILINCCIALSYEVGETISTIHQSQNFEICYAPELDPNGDGNREDSTLTQAKLHDILEDAFEDTLEELVSYNADIFSG